MSRPVSRFSIITAIVRKDLAEYGRDKLWAFLTIMVLVVVIVLFWMLPDDVNESIRVGVSGLDDSSVDASIGNRLKQCRSSKVCRITVRVLPEPGHANTYDVNISHGRPPWGGTGIP